MSNEYKIIRKYDAIEGIYGERYEVNTQNTRLTKLFDSISVWTTNTKVSDYGGLDVTYELLIGQKLEDNPLIMETIKMNNAIII